MCCKEIAGFRSELQMMMDPCKQPDITASHHMYDFFFGTDAYVKLELTFSSDCPNLCSCGRQSRNSVVRNKSGHQHGIQLNSNFGYRH